MKVLGIETSCDETAVAVVEDGRSVLSNLIASQAHLHQKFGGVVPEVAARAHLENINPLIELATTEAGISLAGVDAVAVTVGPGLVGALLVGIAAAKALALALGVPFIGVNHLEGHIYANVLQHGPLEEPHVTFLVSGGHTMLVYSPEPFVYEVLGQTLDDAAGEAFDKVARFLGLGFPGGPALDELAQKGNPDAIRFPGRPPSADTTSRCRGSRPRWSGTSAPNERERWSLPWPTWPPPSRRPWWRSRWPRPSQRLSKRRLARSSWGEGSWPTRACEP
jgi:N6-L-threonylcarbamoyladenine synthase